MTRHGTAKESAIVTSENSMSGFFQQEVETAVGNQRLKVSDHTKSYIVSVLTEYSSAQTLHGSSSPNDTLAMLYLRSQQVPMEERVRLLRRLGDMALCISGFFADSLNRKVVDIDYYIQMGGGAYGSLAAIFDNKRDASVFVDLYDEMARKFSALVEVLNEVSEGVSGRDQSMLRIYDRWLKTGSDRMHRMLVERGVLPNTTLKRTFQ
jgi:hypothetical protein